MRQNTDIYFTCNCKIDNKWRFYLKCLCHIYLHVKFRVESAKYDVIMRIKLIFWQTSILQQINGLITQQMLGCFERGMSNNKNHFVTKTSSTSHEFGIAVARFSRSKGHEKLLCYTPA